MTLSHGNTLSQKPSPSIPHPTQSMPALRPTPNLSFRPNPERSRRGSGETPVLALLRFGTIRVPYPLALFAKRWGIERSSTALLKIRTNARLTRTRYPEALASGLIGPRESGFSRWGMPSSPRHKSISIQYSKALLILLATFLISPHLHAQESQPKAMQALQAAVQSELSAAETDKSNWEYRDHDVTAGHNAVFQTIETPHGQLRRLIELNGRPLDEAARNAESDRIAEFVNDPAAQVRAHKAGAHDDAQATQMTKMLPNAFLWTVTSETPEFITLNYRPNPNFDPPDMEARVMSIMAGEMIIARNGNRIRTLKGALTEDVKFGWGFFGRLYAGGTFDIERREVSPGHWQITESNVHIGGHALIFKTIGQQEDESKTDWKPSTAKTLREAEEQLRDAK